MCTTPILNKKRNTVNNKYNIQIYAKSNSVLIFLILINSCNLYKYMNKQSPQELNKPRQIHTNLLQNVS